MKLTITSEEFDALMAWRASKELVEKLNKLLADPNSPESRLFAFGAALRDDDVLMQIPEAMLAPVLKDRQQPARPKGSSERPKKRQAKGSGSERGGGSLVLRAVRRQSDLVQECRSS